MRGVKTTNLVTWLPDVRVIRIHDGPNGITQYFILGIMYLGPLHTEYETIFLLFSW
jgi:hypothetical protein